MKRRITLEVEGSEGNLNFFERHLGEVCNHYGLVLDGDRRASRVRADRDTDLAPKGEKGPTVG